MVATLANKLRNVILISNLTVYSTQCADTLYFMTVQPPIREIVKPFLKWLKRFAKFFDFSQMFAKNCVFVYGTRSC